MDCYNALGIKVVAILVYFDTLYKKNLHRKVGKSHAYLYNKWYAMECDFYDKQ